MKNFIEAWAKNGFEVYIHYKDGDSRWDTIYEIDENGILTRNKTYIPFSAISMIDGQNVYNIIVNEYESALNPFKGKKIKIEGMDRKLKLIEADELGIATWSNYYECVVVIPYNSIKNIKL